MKTPKYYPVRIWYSDSQRERMERAGLLQPRNEKAEEAEDYETRADKARRSKVEKSVLKDLGKRGF